MREIFAAHSFEKKVFKKSGKKRKKCEKIAEKSSETAPLIFVLSQRIDARREALWHELPGTVFVDMPFSARALSIQSEWHFGGPQEDS